MDYIQQLNEFYSTLNYNNLSTNAIAIYQAILHIANKAGIIENLSIANSTLKSICNLTEKELQNARNQLLNKKYIDYKRGVNQNNAPKYSVSMLYDNIHNKVRQPYGQPYGQALGYTHGQPYGQSLGYINTLHYNTTLDLFFDYINNSAQDFFENGKDKINLQDKEIILMHLKRLRDFHRRCNNF